MKLGFSDIMLRVVCAFLILTGAIAITCLTALIITSTYKKITKTPESCASVRGVESADKG